MKFNVLFMGTPDFAIPALNMLAAEHNICAVITQTDKPKGRGRLISQTPVKSWAISNNIPYHQPETLKDNAIVGLLYNYQPDLIIVAAYGKILPQYILSFPKYGCINIHASLLPKYRGAAPIQRAIINGEKETGVTIMYMSKGIDCGDILLAKPLTIGEYESAGELFYRLSILGAELLKESLQKLSNSTLSRIPQNDNDATYAPMIDKSEGKINFLDPAIKIKNLVFGLLPSPTAFVECRDYLLKIFDIRLGSFTDKAPGEVVSITKNGIEIACGDNKTVVLKQVQRQGKSKIDAYAFAMGAKIQIGTKFGI